MQKLSEKKYSPIKDLVFRKEAGGSLLFNPDTGNVYALNDTGTLLWRKLSEGATSSQLLKKFKQAYPDIDEKKMKKDLQIFLKQLLKHKLIKVK